MLMWKILKVENVKNIKCNNVVVSNWSEGEWNMIEIEENKHKLLELENKIKSLGDSLWHK